MAMNDLLSMSLDKKVKLSWWQWLVETSKLFLVSFLYLLPELRHASFVFLALFLRLAVLTTAPISLPIMALVTRIQLHREIAYHDNLRER